MQYKLILRRCLPTCMIPDEIIRRRIPPAYGYRIPHSEFTDQQDPSLLESDGYSSRVENPHTSKNVTFNAEDRDGSRHIESEDSINRSKIVSSSVFPGVYSRRIAGDQSVIASDIRKYLSSIHLNPTGSGSFFERRQRVTKPTSLF